MRRSQNSFVRIAGMDQGGKQLRDVVRASSLHGDVNGGVTQIDSMVGPVIRGFDDVGPVVGQNPGEPVQRPRIVRQVNAQTHEASILHQTAFDNARQ